MRLRLAQLMHQEINLLILDEPTNHLDIEARETLEEALADFQGSLLIVSHDRYFLQKTVDGVFWIENGGIVRYEGTYEEAREKRRQSVPQNDQPAQHTEPPLSPTPTSTPTRVSAPAPKQHQQAKRINPYKLAELEKKIAEREEKKERLQSMMAAPDVKYHDLLEWQREMESCQQELDTFFQAWMEMQVEE